MSEEDRKTEELEEELESETTGDDGDQFPGGEELYGALLSNALVTEPWDDLSDTEKQKYQNVYDATL